MIDVININPWLAAGIIFITQVGFIYFRTINMIHTAQKLLWKSIFSGWGVGITWLLGITLSVSSMINLQWQPLIAFLLAGAVGTYIGIKTSK